MNSIRKILAGFLSTVVLIGLLPTMAFADEGEPATEVIEVTEETMTETEVDEIAETYDAPALDSVSSCEEQITDEACDAEILGYIAYCVPFKNIQKIKKLSDIPEEYLVDIGNSGPSYYDTDTKEIKSAPIYNNPSTPRGMDIWSWNVYTIDNMKEPLVYGEQVRVFDVTTSYSATYKPKDLVFVANLENLWYAIEYFDLDDEFISPFLLTDVTAVEYRYDATKSFSFKLPLAYSQPSDANKIIAWFDGKKYYAGGATYTIPADTIGAVSFWEKEVDPKDVPPTPGPGPTPTPGEIIPTKNGVSVALNDDGDKTVTLLDGVKYGKKASINTVKGQDKKTYKITQIAEGAFKDDEILTSATIGTNVKIIGDNAFSGCVNLKSANTGSKVETIGASAFNGCSSLKTLTIGAGVVVIGEDAFKDCDSLSSLTVNMANIPDELFKDSTSLTKLKMGATVKTVGDSSFNGCANMKSVALGSKLEIIGDQAFAGSGITKANISGRVSSVGQGAFQDCPNLTSANTGKYTKTIGSSAFQNCPKLKTAGIGVNVETIGSYTYADCPSLKSVTIGKSVTYIGEGTYSGDINLATVKVNSKNLIDDTSVGTNFLEGIKPTATIKLPKSVFEDTKSVFEDKSGAGDQVKYKKF